MIAVINGIRLSVAAPARQRGTNRILPIKGCHRGASVPSDDSAAVINSTGLTDDARRSNLLLGIPPIRWIPACGCRRYKIWRLRLESNHPIVVIDREPGRRRCQERLEGTSLPPGRMFPDKYFRKGRILTR